MTRTVLLDCPISAEIRTVHSLSDLRKQKMANSARALNNKQTTPDSSIYLGGDVNAGLRANRFVK